MDISNAILAKSDQLNASDLMGGPQTVTIISVKEGTAEQMVSIITDVFGPSRAFKPSKTVLRVLASAWKTTDTTTWVGRRLELYRDPAVRWAGEEIGGIRIKGMSHIDKPISLMLATSKGKFAKSTVQPLADIPTPDLNPILAAIHTAPTLTDLQAAWASAGAAGVQGHPDVIAAKDARKVELGA